MALEDGLSLGRAGLSGLPVHRRDDPEASARGIAFLALGRPSAWSTAPRDEVFAPVPDPALAGRYRRWRALMREATGV